MFKSLLKLCNHYNFNDASVNSCLVMSYSNIELVCKLQSLLVPPSPGADVISDTVLCCMYTHGKVCMGLTLGLENNCIYIHTLCNFVTLLSRRAQSGR